MTSQPPLQGVKVLDLTRLLPGPVCTQHLADMGADVIKIEDTGAGDYAAAPVKALVNRNKRGIRLDLKQAAGVQAFLDLARDADIVVEGFRPGIVDRLGIGYEKVAGVNPRVVYCSITGYGQSGPFRDLAGHDMNYGGYAGALDQVGSDASTLALSNLPVADLMGGSLTAAMGILAALFDASRTGRGRYLDVAISDGTLAHAVLPLARVNAEGKARPAGGDSISGGLPNYRPYRTRDGRVLAVAALEPKFWETFCDTIARPDLKACDRNAPPEVLRRIQEEVARVVASMTLSEWEEKLAGVDCCVSPVLKLEETLRHPHFRERGMVHDTVHPRLGSLTHVGFPVKMSRFAFSVARQAPAPGEHTVEVLRELGYAEEDITALRECRAAL
ncbi:CaiB/BaiF CoA transferase family protein [Noviherbaspirillum galbum]|uniref:CoA transferase n=1 Tax=Noviherbaspirillum galbum TaxID=2709383 RepID=A0A6B3SVZ2_9BURK|nr:CaiB/BaiF CoA-transferase family protein [Noviherbaspirillum galbum]NEX64824.1 CoA transferase [Noviherbaspirillum galbum]